MFLVKAGWKYYAAASIGERTGGVSYELGHLQGKPWRYGARGDAEYYQVTLP